MQSNTSKEGYEMDRRQLTKSTDLEVSKMRNGNLTATPKMRNGMSLAHLVTAMSKSENYIL